MYIIINKIDNSIFGSTDNKEVALDTLSIFKDCYIITINKGNNNEY